MAQPRCTPRVCLRGFTLIELVVVMVLIATLAVVALPRLLDLNAWRLRAYGDQLQAELQAMQRLSIAQRRSIVATVTPGGVSAAYGNGASFASLTCPSSLPNCIQESGSRSVTFNSGNSGSSITSTGTALPITLVTGSTTQRYQIETETGLIRTLP
jgi:prepilin-type N-terminal cleavage/methylation domain-containing protein